MTPIVKDVNGVEGTVEMVEDGNRLLIHLDGRRQVILPKEVLIRQEEDRYFAPFSLERIARQDEESVVSRETLTIPVIEESARLETRQRTTGRVRVTKTVNERQETLSIPVVEEEAEVERIPVNRVVERAPAIRHEDETIIVPVLEEILVIEKRILIREEIHIKKKRTERLETEEVTLRSEDVAIERIDVGTDDH